MLYTSAEAAKLLRKLNDDKFFLEKNEIQSSTFRAAITENIEDARPVYDYEKTQSEIPRIFRLQAPFISDEKISEFVEYLEGTLEKPDEINFEK